MQTLSHPYHRIQLLFPGEYNEQRYFGRSGFLETETNEARRITSNSLIIRGMSFVMEIIGKWIREAREQLDTHLEDDSK